MMQASDNSVPSWTRVEILKEIFKSDQAWNGLLTAYISLSRL